MIPAVVIACLSIGLLAVPAVDAQSSEVAMPSISVGTNLVLVPALVKTKSGEIVFSLSAADFLLTDNGDPQTLQLEPDTGSQPLALAVIIQTGGSGAAHFQDYRGLDAVLDAVIGVAFGIIWRSVSELYGVGSLTCENWAKCLRKLGSLQCPGFG